MEKELASLSQDELLLAKSCEQDQEAFETLVQSWTPRLYALGLRILRDRQQAEEALQDAFFRIWQKACSFDPGLGRPSSWMFAILHRISIDRLRSNRVRGAGKVDSLEELLQPPGVRPSGGDPWQRLRMQAALETLSEAQRQVVAMAYFEGLSREEMAERLNEPLGTVKTRLRDALLKLKREFRDPKVDLAALEKGLSMPGRS